MNQIECVFAAYSNNDEIRAASSSGGIFTELSNVILEDNGVVYGVAMSDDCYSAKFIRVTDSDGLKKLQGSKYLQANVDDTFNKVKSDLNSGLNVLFSGTGCQINGLKLYLHKYYSNLICIDVICHGTPSQYLWERYVKNFEKKYGKLKSVSFRSKDQNWENFGMKENQLFISKDIDSYMKFFLEDKSLRPSCYNCRSKRFKQSDITIADFWGISKFYPDMYDEKGTSLVIIRSEKGGKLFNLITERLTIQPVAYEEGVEENKSEYVSIHKPESRSDFYIDMNRMSFSKFERRYNYYASYAYKIKRAIKKILKIDRGGVQVNEQNYGMLFTFGKE